MRNQVPGIFNVAGDGRLPWSEVAAICGKRTCRCRPCVTGLAAAPLERLRHRRAAARDARPAALRPGRRQPPPQAGRLRRTATRRPARSRTSPRPAGCAAPSATAGPAYQLRARRRERSSATPPPSCATTRVSLVDARRSSTTASPSSRSTIPSGATSLTPADGRARSSPPSTSCEADDAVGAVVVTGAPPAFCAGADLGDLGRGGEAGEGGGVHVGLRRLPARRPIDAADRRRGQRRGGRRGHEPGAGVRRAHRRPVGALRHPLPRPRPAPRRRPHLDARNAPSGPQTAAAMVLFGQVLDGEAAAAAGLAWRCVDDDALLAEAIALARRPPVRPASWPSGQGDARAPSPTSTPTTTPSPSSSPPSGGRSASRSSPSAWRRCVNGSASEARVAGHAKSSCHLARVACSRRRRVRRRR